MKQRNQVKEICLCEMIRKTATNKINRPTKCENWQYKSLALSHNSLSNCFNEKATER